MKKLNLKNLYLVVVLMSIVLYGMGVISGLYASKIIKQQTDTEINQLKDSITKFNSNLENIQIQQNFFNLLSDKENCGFSKVAMDYLYEELSYFWNKLPYRIEEYEKKQVGNDFSSLKRDYSFLALKAYVMATQDYNYCNGEKIPILYFYSDNCQDCILQGEYLDKLKIDMSSGNKEVIAFAIDAGLNESSVELLMRYYNITKTPAIIINDNVLYGRAYNEKEIEQLIK